MCGPEDPLFTPLLPLARVPFQAKESVHKTPFWENFEILASTASIFTQILAHKPPNLEIFRSQVPLFRGKCQFASPTLRKSGPHTPTWKKLSAPPVLKQPCRPTFPFFFYDIGYYHVYSSNVSCFHVFAELLQTFFHWREDRSVWRQSAP